MDVLSTVEHTQDKEKNRKWFQRLLVAIAVCLVLAAGTVVAIDPFFHYHEPLSFLEYPLMRENERYQTDGILRNFDYDAIIIGTSMTECFKTSDMEWLFDVNAVKTPLAGCNFKEANDNLIRAFEANPDIKMVLRSFEYQAIALDKDERSDLYDYADYLTNDNPFDDAPYVLNKEVMGRAGQVLLHTLRGQETTNFDEYANWMNQNCFGAEYVYTSYNHRISEEPERVMTDEERETIHYNLQQNIVAIANEHPETTFYLFFPPYSIAYWDKVCNDNELEWHLEMEKIAMEEVLQCPNIRLYSFSMDENWILNFDNYCDLEHYAEWINYGILKKMAADESRITKENYLDHIAAEREFFSDFDYQTFWWENMNWVK